MRSLGSKVNGIDQQKGYIKALWWKALHLVPVPILIQGFESLVVGTCIVIVRAVLSSLEWFLSNVDQ
jgi:hypothetical protein